MRPIQKATPRRFIPPTPQKRPIIIASPNRVPIIVPIYPKEYERPHNPIRETFHPNRNSRTQQLDLDEPRTWPGDLPERLNKTQEDRQRARHAEEGTARNPSRASQAATQKGGEGKAAHGGRGQPDKEKADGRPTGFIFLNTG